MGRIVAPAWLLAAAVVGCAGTPPPREPGPRTAPRRAAAPAPDKPAGGGEAREEREDGGKGEPGAVLADTRNRPVPKTEPAAAPHKACGEAPDCRRRGQCSMAAGKCVAGSDGDCAQSVDCRDAGRCIAQGGVCVVGNDADCARSYGCKTFGSCRARGGVCQAVSDSDCQQSTACAEYKLCRAEGGRCVE